MLQKRSLESLETQQHKFQINHHHMIDFYHQEIKNNKLLITQYQEEQKKLLNKIKFDQLRKKNMVRESHGLTYLY